VTEIAAERLGGHRQHHKVSAPHRLPGIADRPQGIRQREVGKIVWIAVLEVDLVCQLWAPCPESHVVARVGDDKRKCGTPGTGAHDRDACRDRGRGFGGAHGWSPVVISFRGS
jgi:hypothetical protein